MATNRTQSLIDEAARTRERILRIIAEKRADGYTPVYLRRQLERIDKELQSLQKRLEKELEAETRARFLRAVLSALATLGVGAAATRSLIPRMERSPALASMIYDQREKTREAIRCVGRRIEDAVRDITVRSQMGMLEREYAAADARRALIDELIATDENGIGGVRYKNGAVMPFDKYLAMVIRTSPRQASNLGVVDAALEVGDGLVRMSTHYPTCPVCAPRQGRVYRVEDFAPDDERQRFPYIDKAFPGWPEYPIVHPNCKHTLTTVAWLSKTEDERAAMLAEAGAPFDTDTRAEAEIALYNNMQRILRIKNQDRKLYERYRAVLGGDAPNTFASFRSIKYNKQRAWGRLKREYILHNRIDANENYSPEYKQRLKDAYVFFKKNGYEFTEHGLGRALNPKHGKGKRIYTLEDILQILKRPANYREGNTRLIKLYDDIAVLQAVDTGEIISIIASPKAGVKWEAIFNDSQ